MDPETPGVSSVVSGSNTTVEIAAILGCRPGSVGPLVSRGLAAMRIELEER